MVTRRPRALSRRPRLEAVRPLPRLDATPPVTKRCLVDAARDEYDAAAKGRLPVVGARRRWPPVHGPSEYQLAVTAARSNTSAQLAPQAANSGATARAGKAQPHLR